jgi:hypothetical protein
MRSARLAAGGGVYEVLKDGTSGPVFTQGDRVYWDDSANQRRRRRHQQRRRWASLLPTPARTTRRSAFLHDPNAFA